VTTTIKVERQRYFLLGKRHIVTQNIWTVYVQLIFFTFMLEKEIFEPSLN